MRRLLFAGLIAASLSVGAVAQVPTPVNGTATEVDRLTKQVNELLDQLAIARAQRGDCETTLAPLEAQARRTDSDQRWDAQKAAMEKARPGFECNPRTLECSKKPEPPKTPGKDDSKK